MKQQEIFRILDGIAPFNHSKEFSQVLGFEDNSGILVETQEEIDKILVTMDLTDSSLQKAVETGAKLIITHHPVIFHPIKRIDGKLMRAVKNGIGVISMHLNLDVNAEGTDFWLYKGLGGEDGEILQPFANAGYGRLFKINPSTLSSFAERAKEVFKTDRIITYGNPETVINKVASFCGAGLDVGEIYASKDADLLVSSDVKHHVIVEALEQGKCLMILTHYASENYGLKMFAEKLKNVIKNAEIVFFEDKQLL